MVTNSSWLVICLFDNNKRQINGSDGTIFTNLKKMNALKDRVNSDGYLRFSSLGARYAAVVTYGEWNRKSVEDLEKLDMIDIDKFQKPIK